VNDVLLRGALRALAPVGQITQRIPHDTVQLLSFAASPAVRANPWDLYRRFHARRTVLATPFGVWIVASHADVTALLRHPSTSVDEALAEGVGGGADRSGPFTVLMDRTILFRDPPDHARLRRLVVRAFTPRTVERLRPRVEAKVDEQLSALRSAGRADLIADFALPFPVAVICDLLGVLAEDRPRFLGWARHLAPRLDISVFRDAEKERLGDEAAVAIAAFLDDVIGNLSRRDPDGLISALVAVEEDGDSLSRDEVVALCALLLVAGFETTMNLIGNGVYALLRHPEQLERVRDGEVAPETAVNELLRFEGPVQFTQRVTCSEIEVGGQLIPERALVGLLLGAANRDPLVFEQPDVLDVGRDPNPHLAFSFGIHHCLGAALARMEAEAAIPAIVRMLPDLRLAARPRWRDTFVLRGVQSLPARWTATQTTGLRGWSRAGDQDRAGRVDAAG
jgi:cytochrome P450